MKKIIVILAFLLTTTNTLSNELEFDIGQTKYQPSPEGIWWQESYPRSWSLTPLSYSARWWTDQSPNGWQYGLGYINLGKVSLKAEALAIDFLKPPTSFPVSHWNGSGEVHGITLNIKKNFGDFYVVGGGFINKPTWTENIPDYVWCNPPCSLTYQVPSGIANITVSHKAKWQVGNHIGVGFKYKQTYTEIASYSAQANGDDTPAGYQGRALRASVGFRF